MKYRALIVEDNPDIARLVQIHLRDIDCESDITGDGTSAIEQFQRRRYDLVVLDLMLPELDGLAVCKRLRTLPGYVPILMLTAKSSELDHVIGLESGADDYLTKPFSIPELQARVRALFRRVEAMGSAHQSRADEDVLEFGELSIDPSRRRVQVSDRGITLTAKEFDLLLHFARHPGRVYSRAELLDQVWSYGHEGYEHTVNSHINRLRSKLEQDPARPRYILTVWGVGYKFADRET